MIRIKGFARKTRRQTKGGSMSENAADPGCQNSDSQHPTSHAADYQEGHRNGNGSEPEVVNNREQNGLNPSEPKNVSKYLKETVAGLVVSARSARRGSRPFGSNGAHADGSSINGEPVLQTLFAGTHRSSADATAKRYSIPLWKRVLDVSLILLTLPIWLPVLILVMLWIKAVSPGPIFYRQERVGFRRSRFMIFKFRTMHVNAETRSHEEYFAHLMRLNCPMTKLDAVDDSRLVRCGRLLRASGLDELPQIFNVLRGDMSLVGPRPCLPKEFERYQPWHQKRVNAQPGLTGYWQVNGKNKTTFSEMIAMDILYTQKQSIWLDLTIMLKTIPALISQTIEARGNGGSDLRVESKIPVQGARGSTTKI